MFVESLSEPDTLIPGRRGFGILLDAYIMNEKVGTKGAETGAER